MSWNDLLKIFTEATELKGGESKIIECPCCGGKMVIGKSAYNGHIRAMCEKEGCMKMIQ